MDQYRHRHVYAYDNVGCQIKKLLFELYVHDIIYIKHDVCQTPCVALLSYNYSQKSNILSLALDSSHDIQDN
jgi:hypothetical protein